MELQIEAPDALAVFRQQVAQEKDTTGKKFSDAVVAKFAAIKNQEKADAVESERFKSALRLVIVTPDNLTRLIERCNTSKAVTDVQKRVVKLS